MLLRNSSRCQPRDHAAPDSGVRLLHQLTRALPFFLAFSLPLFLASCDNEATPSSYRYVYLPVSTTHGASSNQTGIFRYSLAGGTPWRVNNVSAEYLTAVADNGIVLTELGDGLEHRLWGKCTDGTLIPVPFPVAPDVHFTYRYSLPPRLTLSRDGHHAAYPVQYVSTTSSRIPAEQRLVLFNCAKWEMTTISVSDFVKRTVPGAEGARMTGEHLLFSPEGLSLLFVAEALTYPADVPTSLGFLILEAVNDSLRILGPLNSVEPVLKARDPLSGTCLLVRNQALKVLHANGSEADYPLSPDQVVRPMQNALSRSELVVWNNDEVALHHPVSGQRVSTVVTREALSRLGTYAYDTPPSVSISADGEWIAILLERAPSGNQSRTQDLLTCRRDGTGLVKLASGVRGGFPVVSGDLDNPN